MYIHFLVTCKMKRTLFLYSGIICLLLISSSRCQLNALETKHQRLIYFDAIHDYLVPHVARCFENAWSFHHRLFGFGSEEKITIFLHDFSDFGNASADVVPRDGIVVGIAPLSYVYETSPANERMNTTMNHELTHIVAMDMSTKSDRFFRSIFLGKVRASADNPLSMLYSYFTTPRRYAPRWYHEGIAVFMETWMAGGIGRALGAYDEMVFRTMVHDSSYFYDLVGLESEGTQIDFQVGVNAYLYGTRFISYLAVTYGPKKLITWVRRSQGSAAYFAAQFQKVYDIGLSEAWQNWIKFEHQFQKKNLKKIYQNRVTPYRLLTKNTLGSVSRSYRDPLTGHIYVAVLFPGQTAFLAELNPTNGQTHKLTSIKGPALYFVTSLAFDAKNHRLFYTTNNNGIRDLYAFDLKTSIKTKLLAEARTGDLTFNPVDKSLWGVRHYNGISTLVHIPYPYSNWKQIYSFPYGKDIYDIDISPDGKSVSAALIDISGRQKLILLEVDSLQKGKHQWKKLFDFENSSPAGFVFTKDGKYLYGSSYYSGVSNIFRYNFANHDMQAISNAATGFFRPLPFSNDSLLVYRYSSKGFKAVFIENKPVDKISAIKYLGQAIVEKYPIVKKWKAGSPGRINIDSLTIADNPYNGFINMRLVSAYPVIEGYKTFGGAGYRVNLSDPLGLNRADISFSYTPIHLLTSKERIHLKMNYTYLNWSLSASYNNADFYDLFGPTRSSRKGYALRLTHNYYMLYDTPRVMGLNFQIAGYSGLDKLPSFQNISTPFDQLLSGSVRFSYRNMQGSLGAVDAEKGFRWQVVSNGTLVQSTFFPLIYSTYDLGFPLTLKHSSIWLRSAFGHVWGQRDNPFANIYFGGFGNNYIDHQNQKRYRAYYSFPGVELNEIAGNTFIKTMLDWNLPPLRFRRVGIPSFYLSWANMSIFSNLLSTNPESRTLSHLIMDTGVQIDFRLVFLSHLKATLSIGFAEAFEKKYLPRKEWMLSLKIM